MKYQRIITKWVYIPYTFVFAFILIPPGIPHGEASSPQSTDTDTGQIADPLASKIIHRADSLYLAGQPDSALTLSTQIIHTPEVSDTLVAHAHHLLGKIYDDREDYNRAEYHWRKALEIRVKYIDKYPIAAVRDYHNLSSIYLIKGEYKRAEQHSTEAISILNRQLEPNPTIHGACLAHLGLIKRNLGDFQEAKSNYLWALDILNKAEIPDKYRIIVVHTYLANLFDEIREFKKAESHYREALMNSIEMFGTDHPLTGTLIHNRAILYRNMGKYEDAEKETKKALNIFRNAKKSDQKNLTLSLYIANSIISLAELSWRKDEYVRAESLYIEAINILELIPDIDPIEIANAKHGLAIVYRDKGESERAESLFQESLNTQFEIHGQNHLNYAIALTDYADLLRFQGNYKEAKEIYTSALEISQKIVGDWNPEVALIREKLAKNYCSQGKFDEGLEQYKLLMESRHHFIDEVFIYASEDQKARYILEYPVMSHSLLSLALMSDSEDAKESALEMTLRGKAFVVDAVSKEKEITYCKLDQETVEIAARHADVCGEIATLTLAGTANLEPDIYHERLQTLYHAKDSLETELSVSCAEFRDALTERRLTVTDLANAIPRGAVLWEFFRYNPYDFDTIGSDKDRTGAPRYLTFTLDQMGNISLMDLGDADEIERLVLLARRMIYESGQDVFSIRRQESEERIAEVTEKLYEAVFSPLVSKLADNRDVFISPDGQLSLLPFEILPCPDVRYAIEKYSFSYLSSGRDFLKFNKEKHDTDRVLIIADPDFDLIVPSEDIQAGQASQDGPLDWVFESTRGAGKCLQDPFKPMAYGRDEAHVVQQLLQNKSAMRVETYYRGKAREEVVKEQDVPPAIIHLATHGFFCEDTKSAENRMLENPLLRSGLALAGANQLIRRNENATSQVEDGILTALEVSGLNLIGTELVVLSACETGIGDVKNGEGVYGLRRAFQHAGAQTIVMSLWKVPDKETYEIMVGFYENWLRGETKKEALRQSVLNVIENCRKNYGVAHPFLWGGIMMIGNQE